MYSHKHARTRVPINRIISKRWSSRAYDPNRPVDRNHLIALAEAARWAPSSSGIQPWRFVFFDRFSDEKAWNVALSCLHRSNQSWAQFAPVLILVCAYQQNDQYQVVNRWAQYDTGGASENLCLQATDLGLMTRQIGGFDEEKTRQTLSVPVNNEIIAFIAIGYQGRAETLKNESHAQQEISIRDRAPLSENFFINVWGNGLDEAPPKD